MYCLLSLSGFVRSLNVLTTSDALACLLIGHQDLQVDIPGAHLRCSTMLMFKLDAGTMTLRDGAGV